MANNLHSSAGTGALEYAHMGMFRTLDKSPFLVFSLAVMFIVSVSRSIVR